VAGATPAPPVAAAATDAVPMLSNRRLIIAGAVMALSNFMVILDLTIANVSVPHIAGDLGITTDQGAWIITSYAVAEAICVPLTGWLAARFGAVRLFVAAMLGFGLMSLLCGIAPTLGVLVAARIGQGLCGAPLMPMTQMLMLRVFPPEKRTIAMTLWAMTTMLAPALGPIVGGYISDNYSWHWIFLINVPIALVCTAVGAWVLRPAETEKVKLPIDKVGLVLLVFWIGCLQIMLDTGRDHDWFGDWKIVALAICAGLGLIAFVIWELTEEHPIVDLRIFRHLGFTTAVVSLAVTFGAYFASIVVIPQWLQITEGYSAQDAGLVTAFTAMSSFLMAMTMPRWINKVDMRIPVTFGIGWLAIQSMVRMTWSTGMDFWSLATPQIVQGFGISLIMMPLTQMSLGAVKPNEIASAAGLQNFLRTMAIAIATSLVLTDWGNQQRVSHTMIADRLQPDATAKILADSGMGPDTARVVINNLVDAQASTIAMDHTFMVAAIVLVLAMPLVWFSGRPKMAGMGGEAAH
jgi:DHA2 family multidrug resistance protein